MTDVDTITLEEYEALLKKEKRPKFNNRKVEAYGYTFDSDAEYRHYGILLLRQREGAITDLVVHPPFVLMDGFRASTGKWIAPIAYEGDFAFTEVETGQKIVQDVKAVRTAVFNIKRKMFLSRYPDIRFEIIDVLRRRK